VKDLGELGLGGWEIRAYVDANGNGTLDVGETTIAASATTAPVTGAYTLTLNPGSYVVCEVRQSGWFESQPANTNCVAGTGLGPGGYALTVTSGSSGTGNDFGNFQKGSKSGVKYNDLNGNGAKDVGEPGLAGWTIRAYVDANGNGMLDAGETTVATSAVTDGSGAYSLSLNPGKYIICEVQQAPWTQSQPANTKCGASSGGYAVTVTSGSTDPGNNFGNFQKGTKSGVKFNDLNGNGVKDMGEPGLLGWEIRAYKDLDGDGTLSAAEAAVGPATSMTTNGSGAYSFSLNPGKYVICEVLQSGWFESKPANVNCAGGSGFSLGPGGFAVTVTSGSSEPNNDFGNFRRGTKAGVKFNDQNGNGVKDAGEPGLPGWTINAYVDANGNGMLDAGETTIAASAVTDMNGAYSLMLNPGMYVVCEVRQPTWTQSKPANTKCAAGTGLGSGGYGITVTSGWSETANDFGNFTFPPFKVTGGGQIPVPDPDSPDPTATGKGRATFGFVAQPKINAGHLNYVNHVNGLHVNGPVLSVQVIAINPDGSPKTVEFSGICDNNTGPCSFTVTVEDHGEPGRNDEFGIVVVGGKNEARSQRVISRGNIQFHKADPQAGPAVTAAAAGVFPSGAQFNGIPLNGLQVGKGVLIVDNGSALGHALFVLMGTTLLGQPQQITVEGEVASGSVGAPGAATLSGTCSVDMGDGTAPVPGVPFTVTVVTDAQGQGTLTLILGATTLPAATIRPGSITVQ